ncbi:hypothetical protein [Magnetospirillum moscoviense]|uniref:hypothetical protein n=1 Tax=Magnetospirillum moscoviense TaxID=1437059 RepID=UPI0012E7BAC5|nr:hypothetical protein [Magnetospirillum moscoviense]
MELAGLSNQGHSTAMMRRTFIIAYGAIMIASGCYADECHWTETPNAHMPEYSTCDDAALEDIVNNYTNNMKQLILKNYKKHTEIGTSLIGTGIFHTFDNGDGHFAEFYTKDNGPIVVTAIFLHDAIHHDERTAEGFLRKIGSVHQTIKMNTTVIDLSSRCTLLNAFVQDGIIQRILINNIIVTNSQNSFFPDDSEGKEPCDITRELSP